MNCPPGHYCDRTGMTTIEGQLCDPGFTCLGGSYTSQPIGIPEGDICKIGHYCESGAAFNHPCPPGLACPYGGMSLTEAQSPTFFCAPGFFCSSGALTTEPYDQAEGGGICPAGYYCPSPDPTETDYASGTHVPHPCPPGTYSSSTGGMDINSCQDCPEGYYCEHYGSTNYLVCDEGWFCEGREFSSRPVIRDTAGNTESKHCPVGSYCTRGI